MLTVNECKVKYFHADRKKKVKLFHAMDFCQVHPTPKNQTETTMKTETESKNKAPAVGRPEGLAETPCSSALHRLSIRYDGLEIFGLTTAAGRPANDQELIRILRELLDVLDVPSLNFGRDDEGQNTELSHGALAPLRSASGSIRLPTTAEK